MYATFLLQNKNSELDQTPLLEVAVENELFYEILIWWSIAFIFFFWLEWWKSCYRIRIKNFYRFLKIQIFLSARCSSKKWVRRLSVEDLVYKPSLSIKFLAHHVTAYFLQKKFLNKMLRKLFILIFWMWKLVNIQMPSMFL